MMGTNETPEPVAYLNAVAETMRAIAPDVAKLVKRPDRYEAAQRDPHAAARKLFWEIKDPESRRALPHNPVFRVALDFLGVDGSPPTVEGVRALRPAEKTFDKLSVEVRVGRGATRSRPVRLQGAAVLTGEGGAYAHAAAAVDAPREPPPDDLTQRLKERVSHALVRLPNRVVIDRAVADGFLQATGLRKSAFRRVEVSESTVRRFLAGKPVKRKTAAYVLSMMIDLAARLAERFKIVDALRPA